MQIKNVVTDLDRVLFKNIPGVDNLPNHYSKNLSDSTYVGLFQSCTNYNYYQDRGKEVECPNTQSAIAMIDEDIDICFHSIYNTYIINTRGEINQFPAPGEEKCFYKNFDGNMVNGANYFDLLNESFTAFGKDPEKVGDHFRKHITDLEVEVEMAKDELRGHGIGSFLLKFIPGVLLALLWVWVITEGLNAGANAADGFFAVMFGIGVSFVSWFAMFALPIPALMLLVFGVKSLFPPKAEKLEDLRKSYLRAMHYVRYRVLWFSFHYENDPLPQVLTAMEKQIQKTAKPFAKYLTADQFDFEMVRRAVAPQDK